MAGTGQSERSDRPEDRSELGRDAPTVTALVTAHADTPWGIIANLDDQTRRVDQIIAAVSDWWWMADSKIGSNLTVTSRRAGAPEVYIELHENKNDYGYAKRNALLPKVESEYVGFFSHDDSYELDYVERMMDAAKESDADVVYCGWDEPKQDGGMAILEDCKFQIFQSTLGNFFVRTKLIRSLGGFPLSAVQMLIPTAADMSARHGGIYNINTTAIGWMDGLMIRLLNDMTNKITKVHHVLYHHNQPYWKDMKPSRWGAKT